MYKLRYYIPDKIVISRLKTPELRLANNNKEEEAKDTGHKIIHNL